MQDDADFTRRMILGKYILELEDVMDSKEMKLGAELFVWKRQTKEKWQWQVHASQQFRFIDVGPWVVAIRVNAFPLWLPEWLLRPEDKRAPGAVGVGFAAAKPSTLS